jgi:hypothetical protein
MRSLFAVVCALSVGCAHTNVSSMDLSLSECNQVVLATSVSTDAAPLAADGRCCKVCTAGKACGNTCIAAYKTCHVGPGCACDAH